MCAASAIRAVEIDLFPATLSYIGDIHIAGLWIKGESPRVAYPLQPNLRMETGRLYKRIVRGDAVWFGVRFHIDSQNFTIQVTRRLFQDVGNRVSAIPAADV